ncbi:Right handed beta helix region [Dyadobacter sp. SG02]|uniref:right-handed parallel beta-helix repeat-containing protein n=1 Tax=Dyadobacter sp. SG02 TaxID=1855291 RepID=UPI0008AF9F1C|nr:right-handed parallel beta-helix repeat-containing protein [Dyadobacter sp. SG02]SEJ72526.1 Right handed beta helix region [Dyadobacter sp. SG02]
MKKFLILLLFILVCEKAFSQNKIYLSSSGSDLNSGRDSTKPWKTLHKLYRGYSYLLRRGDTLYFSLKRIPASGKKEKITLGAYGNSDRKPVLSLYKKVMPNAFEKQANDIWRINLRDSSKLKGYTNLTDSNIGFIKVNGVIYGSKIADQTSLAQNWDFMSQDGYLYVKLNKDINRYTIQLAGNYTIIELSDDMIVEDLKLVGTGGHAIQGDGVSNVEIKRVDIAEIGGSYLPRAKIKNTRYGNGIELFNSATNCLIENCSVSQVFDAAYTMQGAAVNAYFDNVVFRNNTADKNEQSFELWIKGWKSGFRNCKFIDNRCSNSGFGWSHAVRTDKNVGVHLLIHAWEVADGDLLISGNQFANPRSSYMFSRGTITGKSSFRSGKNVVLLKSGTPLRSSDSGSLKKQVQTFRKQTGWEERTEFRTIK